jgi:hypothetical protein
MMALLPKILFVTTQEAEVWVAVLRTTITLNSVNRLYDALLYKENLLIEKMKGAKKAVHIKVGLKRIYGRI